MYTIKTLNAISPVGLAKLNNKQFDVAVDTDAPDGILVRSADMLNTAFNDNLLAIARAGAGVNNIPLDRCSEQGIVVFNTPGANANAVKELVIAGLLISSRKVISGIEWAKTLQGQEGVAKLVEKYGKDCSYITIGRAGEFKLTAASIACTDRELRPMRHAGRGGVGAVMGSKGIKAIVLDPAGTPVIRKPKNAEAFKAASRAFAQGLSSHPVCGTGLPTYGTNVLVNILNEAGGLPTKNFSVGRFEGADKICAETMVEIQKRRGGNPTHGYHRGCIMQCSGICVDENGECVSKQPEYETVWSHGAHCGVDDLDKIILCDRLEDDYGLDTIETGAALGVLMEAGALKWGDIDGIIAMIHEIGKGTPMGRILGAGTATTARCFGIERAPVVKGQAMPAYDPRAVKGQGVTYATTTMGADHTAGYAVATNILGCGGKTDPLSAEGQAEISRNLQIATAAIDATGYCLFTAFALLDQPETMQALVDTINAMYDLNMTLDDVTELGKDILRKERAFNAAAGFTKAHDRLPLYFSRESVAPHNVRWDVSDEDLDSVFNF